MASQLVTCEGCGHRFAVSRRFAESFAACPNCGGMITVDRVESTDPDVSDSIAAAGQQDRGYGSIRIQLVVAGLTVLLAGVLQMALNGPEFLLAYAFCGLIAAACMLALGAPSGWRAQVAFLWVIALESIGAIRFLYGVTHGMSRFGFLLLAMLAIPFLITFVAAFQNQGTSRRQRRRRLTAIQSTAPLAGGIPELNIPEVPMSQRTAAWAARDAGGGGGFNSYGGSFSSCGGGGSSCGGGGGCGGGGCGGCGG